MPQHPTATKSVRGAIAGAMLLAALPLTSGCAAVINRDPNLRWWAFKTYGADRICPEILKTSVPLKAQGDRSPTIGRYFPDACSYSINEQNRTVVVNVSGSGYAYLPTAKRTSFTLTMAPEYAFDFYLHEDGNWIWGKMTRMAGGPDFKMKNSDNKVLDIAGIVTPAGSVANLFGGQVVGGFVARGFTVVESDEGKEFTLGILPPGKRPFKPMQVDSDDEFTFANETADVFARQQDFLGPFEVADDDQFIVLKGNLVGPNAVDFVVIDKQRGDLWRNSYEAGNGASTPPGNPIAQSVVQPGPFTRKFQLRRGLYYVVVDNSTAVGQASPPVQLPNPLYDSSVRMTYVAQLVED
ncbi:MAG: hypothetical protein HOW73_41645 [Polyangiaceae bacterium]|nr:hypothetical protein [Polyangiaceae bacterium]